MSDRDWADAPYVRVYQSIRDDPKFATVFDDDRALAAWLRLLMDAEPVHPARASLPARLSRYAREVLTKAGILHVTGHTFTLSGLAKERASRAMTGAERSKLWRERHGRNGVVTEPSVSSVTERDVSSETPRGRAGASDSDSSSYSFSELEAGGAGGNGHAERLDGPIAYFEVTQKYPQIGSGLHDWCDRLAEDYGAARFQVALATEFTVSRRMKDLMSRTESRLAMEADTHRRQASEVKHKPPSRTPEEAAEYNALRRRLQEGATE